MRSIQLGYGQTDFLCYHKATAWRLACYRSAKATRTAGSRSRKPVSTRRQSPSLMPYLARPVEHVALYARARSQTTAAAAAVTGARGQATAVSFICLVGLCAYGTGRLSGCGLARLETAGFRLLTGKVLRLRQRFGNTVIHLGQCRADRRDL